MRRDGRSPADEKIVHAARRAEADGQRGVAEAFNERRDDRVERVAEDGCVKLGCHVIREVLEAEYRSEQRVKAARDHRCVQRSREGLPAHEVSIADDGGDNICGRPSHVGVGVRETGCNLCLQEILRLGCEHRESPVDDAFQGYAGRVTRAGREAQLWASGKEDEEVAHEFGVRAVRLHGHAGLLL